MTSKLDALFAILAALLVLFTAILDPRISVALAVASLVTLCAYELWRARHAPREDRQ